MQHTEDYNTRNKYYKDDDDGRYAINFGSFIITEVLRRSRLMEDGNELLLTMDKKKNYTDIESQKDLP